MTKKMIAVVVTSLAGAPHLAAAETVVKVGFCAKTITSAAAPFAVATKKGWSPSGIKVQLVPVPGSTDCVKLVATGDLPYSLPSIEPLPPIIQQGVKAKIFYTAYQGNIYGVAVPKDSPIRSIKDLKGKKIGVASMASGAVPVTRALLAMNGMDPEKDAQIVVVGEAAQAAALTRSGQVAALSLYDTQYALVDTAGVPVRMLDSGPVARFPSNGFVALEETLQKNRAQALALVKGYAMGTVFSMANPEAAVKMLYEVYPQTRPTGKSEEQGIKDDVKTMLARAEHWKLEAGGVKRWGESSIKDFDAYEDFLVKWKVITAKVPVNELVTNELIDEVNQFNPAAIAAEARLPAKGEGDGRCLDVDWKWRSDPGAALVAQGARKVFCVPGESHLGVIDALYDFREKVSLVVCRHESGASNMADAYAKLTGEPGIALVSRGPGATNASIGIHTAFQDSTPLILLIGQVQRDFIDREAFQEVDFRRMFGPMAKWVTQIDDPKRIPEHVSHAFHTATSGRPGPVVLALPEDMLSEQAQAPVVAHYQRVAASPSSFQLSRLTDILSGAQRPILILGGSGWTAEACESIRQFAEAWQLPVTCAFRFQDLFDNEHPQYAGDVGIAINPKLARRIREADVALVIGPRLGEMTTSGYTLFEVPVPRQTLIHVHAGAEELGRVYSAHLPINSGMPEIASVLADTGALSEIAGRPFPWAAETEAAHADYLAWNAPVQVPGPLQFAEILKQVRDRLPADAIFANGAGNFTAWVHRFIRYRRFKSQVAPTSGAMGYGMPAAVAAKLAHPDRMVVTVVGDGDFLMTGQELATAVHYRLPLVILLVNNGIYGTIRMHQERHFPGRVYGTNLTNPDFAAYARAFGAFGEIVERTEQFAPAFERALGAGVPALLELRLPPEVITPTTTLAAIREQALRRHGGGSS